MCEDKPEESTLMAENSNIGHSSKITASEGHRAWVRYRVEHRHADTNELIKSQDVDDFTVKSWDTEQSLPAFEVVGTYKTGHKKPSRSSTDEAPPLTTFSAPKFHMNIYSPAIINALQSVVKYYPSQNLGGDFVVVNWPYPVLVHHYDELTEFRSTCANKNPKDMCIRERDADEHLEILLKFLDDNIMKDVRAEQERNKNGFWTFDYVWVALKPGTTALMSLKNVDACPAKVILSVFGGNFVDRPAPWKIVHWDLRYDGSYLGRFLTTMEVPKFDGEVPHSLQFITGSEQSDEALIRRGGEVARQYQYGKMYWELLRKQCKYHKGASCDFPFNEIDGLVMTDLKAYYIEHAHHKPNLMDAGDCRDWTTDCMCSSCRQYKTVAREEQKSPFSSYNKITLKRKLTAHQYLLCQYEIEAFIFATRDWEMLHVKNLADPKFDENMINSLVMEEDRKRTLKALAKSFARIDKDGNEMLRDMWAADFVKGKGQGLVLLLHGKPGVGKTCTAECIAAFTRRPLMILTSSDIGTDPATVEANLTKSFKTAKSWGAVLLIDEADVFMEQRTSENLIRNTLVAGNPNMIPISEPGVALTIIYPAFLRALEYYNGILFLTTNRVGIFDDAFISRVHLQLYYSDFDDNQRQKIWKTFMDRLDHERRSSIRLTIAAKEYIESAKVKAVKWNGREIRNAFQTAVALAEYDGEKDEDGRIRVTDAHFKPILEMSQSFKNYLEELHVGDEAKRAERTYARLDGYKP
ncbi:hypothetical protein JX265_007560 [Neoarthrinium moseri]|uniref:AAA+ ATPase domain-containing protein n=1 Tax=Neoarthrinium moseri TaxID=1658444 RepID=A0A9Q0APC5_9PEZI|nr:hypothetical protein JX266_000687 [Neoarthrinium moseri]KAI1866984.1 hypothetical protein JX265_007560 [Neoarthrinium moseri]